MSGSSYLLPRAAVPRIVGVLRILVWAMMLGTAGPALAASDVTPAQAATLEAEIREAIASVLGPIAPLPERPVRVTAAGDHYEMLVPIAAEALDGSGKASITGIATPLPGGSWSVENIKASSPLRFTSTMPVPAQGGPRRAQTPIVYTVDLHGQDGRIIWDPSFAIASSWTAVTTGAIAHAEGAMLSQDSKFGPSRSTMTLRPVGVDRADVLLDGTLRDYEIDSLVNDSPVHIGMQRVDVSSALNGMSRSRALTLAQVLTGMAASIVAPQTGSSPRLTEITRVVLAALQDFASEYKLDETIGGFAVRVQDQAFGMERIKIGLAAKSDDGMLQAGMELAMDGLVLPDLPLGPLGAFIPRRVEFHTIVAGLGVSELSRLIQSAADGRDPNPRDITALFSHGGIRGTLESMTVELAGAVFHGEAKVLATGPSSDSVSGTARITAENFELLLQKVSATAEAAQILPVLVLAKGAGRSSGDRFVWDLRYGDGKFLVNDVDYTALMGAPAPASPAPRPNARNAAPAWGGTDGPVKGGTPRALNPKQTPSWGK